MGPEDTITGPNVELTTGLGLVSALNERAAPVSGLTIWMRLLACLFTVGWLMFAGGVAGMCGGGGMKPADGGPRMSEAAPEALRDIAGGTA